MYLIRRTTDKGGWVAKGGSQSSYTHNLTRARKFPTREQAERNLCISNEIIEPLERVLDAARQ